MTDQAVTHWTHWLIWAWSLWLQISTKLWKCWQHAVLAVFAASILRQPKNGHGNLPFGLINSCIRMYSWISTLPFPWFPWIEIYSSSTLYGDCPSLQSHSFSTKGCYREVPKQFLGRSSTDGPSNESFPCLPWWWPSLPSPSADKQGGLPWFLFIALTARIALSCSKKVQSMVWLGTTVGCKMSARHLPLWNGLPRKCPMYGKGPQKLCWSSSSAHFNRTLVGPGSVSPSEGQSITCASLPSMQIECAPPGSGTCFSQTRKMIRTLWKVWILLHLPVFLVEKFLLLILFAVPKTGCAAGGKQGCTCWASTDYKWIVCSWTQTDLDAMFYLTIVLPIGSLHWGRSSGWPAINWVACQFMYLLTSCSGDIFLEGVLRATLLSSSKNRI